MIFLLIAPVGLYRSYVTTKSHDCNAIITTPHL